MGAERVLIWVLLGALALGCVLVLQPFLSAIAWAGILVFTTWPLHEWLRRRLSLPRAAAAGLMVAAATVLILLPLIFLAHSAADTAAGLRRVMHHAVEVGLPPAPGWVGGVPIVGPALARIWDRAAVDLSTLFAPLRPYFAVIARSALRALLGVADGVVSIGFALFIAYFFYVSGESLAARLRGLLHRITGARAERLIAVTGATVRGAVYGILGTAVVQGTLIMFGLWVCGVPHAGLLGLISGILSTVPMGGILVWLPAALWLLGTGQPVWGVLLALYSAIGVGSADSVVRPWFIARGADLPFLLTVLGVLGGVLGFGVLGIFLGPVLLGVGFTLVNEFATGVTPTGPAPGGTDRAPPAQERRLTAAHGPQER
ncbi:MAG TPA: AI-2E family transporter [Acetobacteraceae bacterium]|nr:AI-2E family transporter [Acetobacteraceae bacterium]